MTAPDTDRELLVLAAKAIGATEYGGPDDCRGPGIVLLNGLPTHYEGHGEFGYKWDPLTDDGDALRLAVQLNLLNDPRFLHERDVLMFTKNTPKLEATRLAIVRAAAEVGRAMP